MESTKTMLVILILFVKKICNTASHRQTKATAYPFRRNGTGRRIDMKRRIISVKHTGERCKIFKNNLPPLIVNGDRMMPQDSIFCLLGMKDHRTSTIYRNIKGPLLLDAINIALVLNNGDTPITMGKSLNYFVSTACACQAFIRVFFRNKEIMLGNALANTVRKLPFPFTSQRIQV